MTVKINLPDAEAILRLNKEASKATEELWVHNDEGTIMVDAKSLLGLMPLIGHECKLVAEDGCDPKVLFKVIKKAKLY